MTMPPDAKLQELLLSTADLASASLATRIFISRLRIEVSSNSALLGAKLDELKAFLGSNATAAADLANI